jgi:peptidoglycan/LPS O-acetylase OafA/YrhL
MYDSMNRNQWLDVLRGVAILLVLGRHSSYAYIRPWAIIGWSGVDLFFVLSGFLISGLLFSEYQQRGCIDVKQFWIRRGFKIYPAFYALLTFTAVLIWMKRGKLPMALLGDAFFLQGYAPHILEHGWSLAVEEHFYFVLPLVLLAMMRLSKHQANPFRCVPLISICLTVVCLYLRLHGSGQGATWFSATHLRVDALFCGVTLGYYRHFDPSFPRQSKPSLLLLGLVFLLPPFLLAMTSFAGTVGLTLTFLGFACILLWAVNRKPSRFPLVKSLAWIGRYSYSIYLWHVLTALFILTKVGETALGFGTYLFASIGLGFVLTRMIEIPMLRIRDWWFPSQSVAISPGRLETERRKLEIDAESLQQEAAKPV